MNPVFPSSIGFGSLCVLTSMRTDISDHFALKSIGMGDGQATQEIGQESCSSGYGRSSVLQRNGNR